MTYRICMRPSGTMTGAITFGDLVGRLDVLRVARAKCSRSGQYRLAKLIERHGADTRLPDWKDTITADCPRGESAVSWDVCGARFPDLPAVM